MRILTRYVLKEVFWHGLIGASVFTFVIFMRLVTRILELVVRNSAPVPSVAQLFFLTLPTAFKFTIPTGVLVGILIALSRMAADSEVIAMRAAGLSVRTFFKIIAIFGVSAWLIALANTTLIEPRSVAALTSLEKSMASSQISFDVQPRVFYENFNDMVLYVEDVTAASGAAIWKNVFLADIANPDAPKITIAKQAVVTSGVNTIKLHLINGENHEINSQSPEQYNIYTFQETDMAISLPPVTKPANETVPLTQVSTPNLWRQARSGKSDVARTYLIEFHRRLALPTACLVLMLIGIPLGLSAKKGGRGAGFVLSIVLVFIYYFLSIIGIAMARGGKVAPATGVWMANGIFAFVGMILLWRTDKLPVELGLGHLFSSLKGWSQSRLKLREERLNGLPRRRFLSPTLTAFVVGSLGMAIAVIAFFGPLSRLAGRVPSAAWGEEYLYPLLSLFVVGVIVLLAQRFLLILDDYVLKSFASFLVMILSSFLALVLIFDFFELLTDIVKNRVSLLTVGKYLLNQAPATLYLMTPLGVLLAVLVAFGLMQKSNEITAIKATGISVYRTVIPILAIAMALAGGLFLLDQWYLPYANKTAETLRNAIKAKPTQTYRRPQRWIFGQTGKKSNGSAPDWKIYYYKFYDQDRDEFGKISSFELDPRTFQITHRVYAERAEWREKLNGWLMEDGWQRTFDGDTVTDFRQFKVDTFAAINEPPNYFKKETRQSQEMNYGELRNYIRDLQQSGFDVVRLRVQLQKKIAFPLITLVMAVLAVPFSLSGGRRGALGGVAAAVLIAVVYFVTAGLFEAMGNVSQLPPPVAAWMPDVIFGLAGGYMVFKTPS